MPESYLTAGSAAGSARRRVEEGSRANTADGRTEVVGGMKAIDRPGRADGVAGGDAGAAVGQGGDAVAGACAAAVPAAGFGCADADEVAGGVEGAAAGLSGGAGDGAGAGSGPDAGALDDRRSVAARIGRAWRRFADRWPSGRLRPGWHPLGDLPFDYPPKVVLSADLALLVLGLVACLQRHEYFPTVLPLLAVVLLFLSVPAYVLFGIVPRPLALGLATMVAAALFFAQPVESDFAPFVLMVVAAEIAAIAPKRVSIPLALLATVELVAFAVLSQALWENDYLRTGVPMYALGILLGWLVGVMLQYQRLYLYQERENQNVRAAQAAAAERNRIAREVHDVIAHSLTVTLLHVTAARHALTTDSDVVEASDALADAERLGRQAMADIRRTVGLLDSGRAAAGPEPGADDISDLIDDFANAGVTVRRRVTGELDRISAAVGLALYRICQESLANIAKHAPGAAVEFALEVGARSAVVRVRNQLPPGARIGHGTGVAGMRQRAEGLGGRIHIGPEVGTWIVRAEFPLHDRAQPVGGSAPTAREQHCALTKSVGVPRLRSG
ncbi:sensor histidine kinase [Nocardia carnea]|uniref:sensor histidine kinase n=1 Tax=Nocardia carnea TaxID=37328 RepID=UPI0024571EE6|nr:histidine kinase [Nocardia carnea]